MLDFSGWEATDFMEPFQKLLRGLNTNYGPRWSHCCRPSSYRYFSENSTYHRGRARGRATGNRKQADKAVSECWDLLPDLFRLRAHGATLRDIAANLKERGIKTRKGATGRGPSERGYSIELGTNRVRTDG